MNFIQIVYDICELQFSVWLRSPFFLAFAAAVLLYCCVHAILKLISIRG